MSEMKENRFRRIAGARVNKIINMLKLLGNCSHTGNYSYTKQQVEEIFGRLRSEVDEAYKRYQMCMKNAHLFSLSEESESAYPSASLLLPNGSLLTAKAIDDDNFPAIDVVLLSKNEEEKICFVEFNPERERGGNCASAFIAVTAMKQLIMSRITTERNYNERYSGV